MEIDTEFFRKAIRFWWKTKKAAARAKGRKRVGGASKKQGGTRDANLGGKTMDGFSGEIQGFLVALGVRPEHIFTGGNLQKTAATLPSFYRPSKNWDLAVISDSRFHSGSASGGERHPTLYAAIEFKSQEKSIGNNQNNRMEESLGNAFDFWETYRNSGFDRVLPRPWLGYLFVGLYEPKQDSKAVRVSQPHFWAMPPFRKMGQDTETFQGLSYAERYRCFLSQCIGSRLYDAGAFIVTDSAIRDEDQNYRVLWPEFGPERLLRSLKAQILGNYPGAKVVRGSVAERI